MFFEGSKLPDVTWIKFRKSRLTSGGKEFHKEGPWKRTVNFFVYSSFGNYAIGNRLQI